MQGETEIVLIYENRFDTVEQTEFMFVFKFVSEWLAICSNTGQLLQFVFSNVSAVVSKSCAQQPEPSFLLRWTYFILLGVCFG